MLIPMSAHKPIHLEPFLRYEPPKTHKIVENSCVSFLVKSMVPDLSQRDYQSPMTESSMSLKMWHLFTRLSVFFIIVVIEKIVVRAAAKMINR